jgi:Zn-dependent M28 family amino/carboxypeptidase
MKKTIILSILTICAVGLFAQTQQKRLEEHLYYLASDSLHGRFAGSDDAMKAAQYIIKQYEAIGIEPFYESGYLQPFTNSLVGERMTFNNVIAWIPGSDPALKDEYVIIGAHYDHLGERNGKVYNGADDNASGTAAVIEIARQLKAKQSELKRSVIIVNFDGEELGLFGSNALSNRLKKEKKISKVCLMMSIDMVGWYRQNGKLIVQGTGTKTTEKRK